VCGFRGEFGCSGGKREGWGSTPWYRLTPVFHCVSVSASSALHLCLNQSEGLYLPPGQDTNKTEDSSAAPEGGGDLESGAENQKLTVRCQRSEDNLREDIFFFLEDVDL